MQSKNSPFSDITLIAIKSLNGTMYKYLCKFSTKDIHHCCSLQLSKSSIYTIYQSRRAFSTLLQSTPSILNLRVVATNLCWGGLPRGRLAVLSLPLFRGVTTGDPVSGTPIGPGQAPHFEARQPCACTYFFRAAQVLAPSLHGTG